MIFYAASSDVLINKSFIRSNYMKQIIEPWYTRYAYSERVSRHIYVLLSYSNYFRRTSTE